MSSPQDDPKTAVSPSEQEVNNTDSDVIDVDSLFDDVSESFAESSDSNFVMTLKESKDPILEDLYPPLIEDIDSESDILKISAEDLIGQSSEEARSGNLVKSLVYEPDTAMRTLIKIAKDTDYDDVRIVGDLPTETKIEDIRSEHIGKMVSMEVTITQRTGVKPYIIDAMYHCWNCGESRKITQHFAQPPEVDSYGGCSACHGPKKKYELDRNQSDKIDYQQANAQDLHVKSTSANPETMRVDLSEDMAGKIEAGDTVQLTGIVRSEDDGEVASDYFLHVTGVEHKNESYSGVELSKDDIEEIESMGESEYIISRLASSIAPSITGREVYSIAREAAILQLAGGVDSGEHDRNDIHLMYVGDPGTGKSDLAQATERIAPKSAYVSGDKTTEVGLTASAVRTEQFGSTEWSLSGGPMVKADGGHCVVDELDKAPNNLQRGLQTPLEKQEVIVNKANIQGAKLKTRCSCLFVANPSHISFNLYDSLPAQIDINDAIWSRMDAIIPFVDDSNFDVDYDIAGSILNKNSDSARNTLSEEQLRKYITYARRFEPEMSDEASKYIQQMYAVIRDESTDSGVKVSTRQVESLKRFAEASAKLRLSDTVSMGDAERAVDLMQSWIDMLATDESGSINMERLTAGNASKRDSERVMWEKMNQLSRESDTGGVKRSELVRELDEVLDLSRTDIQNNLINAQIGKQNIDQTDGLLYDSR